MKQMGISSYGFYSSLFMALISCTLVFKIMDYFLPATNNPAGTMNLLLILPLLQAWNMRKQLRDELVIDKIFFMVMLIYVCLFGLISIHLFNGALPNFFAITVGLLCGIAFNVLVKKYQAYRAKSQ